MDLWNKFQTQRGQSGNLGIGGDADYEAFQQQYGIGSQALNKLKQHHQQGVTVGKRKHAEAKPVNIAEEAVKNQWRQMDSAMAGHGYKFDKGTNHWTKPGYPPVKNHWQHTGGQHDYREGDPDQIFAPQRGHQDWSHESGPSGPPYVHPQSEHGQHEASRREAWMGWGPAVFPKTREVTGWKWDNYQNGYESSRPQHFACACGDSFPAPSGFHRCACGRQWNSYVIGTGGNNHEASADKFLVREIPVRPDVIVANRKMAYDPENPKDPFGYVNDPEKESRPHSWDEFEQQYGMVPRHALIDPRTGNMHTLIDPGELGEGEDAGTPGFKKQPKDWARRGDGARWQKSPIGA